MFSFRQTPHAQMGQHFSEVQLNVGLPLCFMQTLLLIKNRQHHNLLKLNTTTTAYLMVC